MPWVSDNEVLTAVAGVHRFVSSASAPGHWAAACAAANTQAYNRLRRVLRAAGYALADLDAWAERADFNLRGAVCYALRRLGLPEGAEGQTLTEYCKVWEELDGIALLLGDDGEVIVPDARTGGIGFGDMTDRTGPHVGPAVAFGSAGLDSPLDGEL